MTQNVYLLNIPHRPKILIQAARICAKKYKRETMLPRLLGASRSQVLELLSNREEILEQERKAKYITYRAQTHVEVLSALMVESKKAA